MKKVIFILGALILTCGMTFAQFNEAKTCPIGKKNGIRVKQVGHRNDVKMHQLGFWNKAKVVQKGHGNEVKSLQRGMYHEIDVYQKGVHNDVNIKQGRRWKLCWPCNEGLFISVIQKGYFNDANIEQKGTEGEIHVVQISKKYKKRGPHRRNEVDLEQSWGYVKLCCKKLMGCKGNVMDTYQEGRNLKVRAIQEGAYNKLYTEQYGYGHRIGTYQLGIGNRAMIVQENMPCPTCD